MRLSEPLGSRHICESVLFDVGRWRREQKKILGEVLSRFSGRLLAVRSSALNEDSWNNSMAGVYCSVTNVTADTAPITAAVYQVIESYEGICEADQVLIQPMVEDVALSGVVLTRDLDTGSPYYIINYDDMSGRTDSVTGGAESKTILVRRSHAKTLHSDRFKRLIDVITQIEGITKSDALDIEFCITKSDEVYILQVRPIAAHKKWGENRDQTIDRTLTEVRDQIADYLRPDKDLFGATTVFGEMPDWNPAEMIGSTPRALALSLYKRLITDRTWLRARTEMGYRDLPPSPLLVDFAGRPFIDIRRSLNSFLPNEIDVEFGHDLINYQLSQLRENRDLHDRIEFEIAITCLDFDFDAKASELYRVGFSTKHVARFRDLIYRVTHSAVRDGVPTIHQLIDRSETLQSRSRAAAALPPRERALQRLSDCAESGILPFAKLARHAFIGISLLRSLVSQGTLTRDDADTFLSSITTIAGELVNDMEALNNGVLSHSDFLDLHGHLRPGTYDITSWRYDEKPEIYLGATERGMVRKGEFHLSTKQKTQIERLLADAQLDISTFNLFAYIEAAVRAREKAKHLFSRNISDALVDLCEWGETVGLHRDSIAHLSVQQLTNELDIGKLHELVVVAKERHATTCAIRLPHLIFDADDIDVVRLPLSRPNFVTQLKATARVCALTKLDSSDIENKIVLIESADPGFDWIFSHSVSGLITKYGGANSHMAIRCAEFSVPAAIGCGERLYETFAGAGIIELDCASRRVRVVRA